MAQPSIPFSVPSGRPEWQPEGEAYWAARQAHLRSPTFGARLTRAEVLAAERLEHMGERFAWIPATKFARTSDMYWVSRDGRPWEIKSPDLDGWSGLTPLEQYRRIASRISDDARWKKRFIVDLGTEVISGGLIRHLSEYNRRRSKVPDYNIDKLVVLSNRQIIEVHLA